MVLSDQEVKDLFEVTHNIKHKAILFLLYSAGLRMSELLGLTWADIDTARGVIYVREGKGKKDRITLLSTIANAYLQRYRTLYAPKHWVFEGSTGQPYSARSVNNIVKKSARLAKIAKNISAHTLRHTFIGKRHRRSLYSILVRSRKFAYHRAIYPCCQTRFREIKESIGQFAGEGPGKPITGYMP